MQTLEVGYLQDPPRIWTWDDRELIQQVARARLEPQSTRLWVQSLTTKPHCLSQSLDDLYQFCTPLNLPLLSLPHDLN